MGNTKKIITLLSFDSMENANNCKSILDQNDIENTIIDKRKAYTFEGLFRFGGIKIEIYENDLKLATDILIKNRIIPSRKKLKEMCIAYKHNMIKVTIITIVILLVLSIPFGIIIKNEIKMHDKHSSLNILEKKMNIIINNNNYKHNDYYSLLMKAIELGDINDSYYFWFLYRQYSKFSDFKDFDEDSYGIILGELSIHNDANGLFAENDLKESIRILKTHNNMLWEKYIKYLKQ